MVPRERTEKIKNPNIEKLNRGPRREREVVIQERPRNCKFKYLRISKKKRKFDEEPNEREGYGTSKAV